MDEYPRLPSSSSLILTFLSHSSAGHDAWRAVALTAGSDKPSCKRSTSVWMASPTCKRTAFNHKALALQ